LPVYEQSRECFRIQYRRFLDISQDDLQSPHPLLLFCTWLFGLAGGFSRHDGSGVVTGFRVGITYDLAGWFIPATPGLRRAGVTAILTGAVAAPHKHLVQVPSSAGIRMALKTLFPDLGGEQITK